MPATDADNYRHTRSDKSLRAWLFLAEEASDDPFVHGIYLANHSNVMLTNVEIEGGAVLTVGEEAVACGGGRPLFYRNVQPGEQVWVDRYDSFLDSDYLIQLTIKIKAAGLPDLVRTVATKGGKAYPVLLWSDQEWADER
ncbi:hypothetical protein E5K04_12620 [Crenobacter intestini]|uniref:Uncharacterized protein n=2 Tax=Crenobacter intestini TaxID=2563443 RepID=A0A4T0UNL8_9NEIS|nr:hypothetical protein E5K04_12620 [Crenobacter intestini]